MHYVPLTSVWARHGLAAVVNGSLEDAGFHPVPECDLYGPMHFYKWPFGSQRPLTIWIPQDEHEDALAFLSASPDSPVVTDEPQMPSIWAVARASSAAFFVMWLVLMVFAGGF